MLALTTAAVNESSAPPDTQDMFVGSVLPFVVPSKAGEGAKDQ